MLRHVKELDNMPYGKGTYGSAKGRPSMKKKTKKKGKKK